MAGAVRKRHAAHVIDDDGRRQPPQHVGVGDDLVAAHMDLHVPADVGHAPRERLDHLDPGNRGRRIEHGEADATHAAFMQRLQFRVRDVGMHHRHAAGIAELRDGIERDAIVRAVGRRLNDHRALRADPFLQAPIVLHTGVRLHARARARRWEARGIVDVHVAIAGTRRRLELGRFGAGRVRHGLLLPGRVHRHRVAPTRRARRRPGRFPGSGWATWSSP